MRKLLHAVIGFFVLVAAPALAADMAVKAPPLPSPAVNWSGFYLGVNAGAGVTTGDFLDPCVTCADLQINAPSFVAGGQLGYNWQRGALVYGFEGDFDWNSANATDPSDRNNCATCTAALKMNAVASVRGRLGLAYDSALFYVTAGPAFGHFNSVVHGAFAGLGVTPVTSTDNVWLSGVAAGAGMEYMLTNNLSVRGEFLYLLFKNSTGSNYANTATGAPFVCNFGAGGPPCGVNFTYSAALVRLGLDWKLGIDPAGTPATSGTYRSGRLFDMAQLAATGWSGFYLGGNLGGGIATGEFLDPCFACNDLKLNNPAFTAGGQLGYNWQQGAFVYGLEGDLNWVRASQTLPYAQGGPALTATFKMEAYGSVRGRMGLAYDSALLYVTAGPAFGHFYAKANDGDTSIDNVWLPGIATGAGVEYMLTNNLSLRGEVLYLLFKDSNAILRNNITGVPVTCASGGPCGINYTYSAVLARAGLDWKIGADLGGPIYKAPVAPPANWAGVYAGFNAGGGIVTGNFLDPCFSCADNAINAPSFIAGGQLGYNWQRGALVYGLEGDLDWISADRTVPYAQGDSPNNTSRLKMDAYGSIRGRMGFADGNALAYVTGGPAFAHVNSAVHYVLDTSTDNVWLPGVAAGAGVEYRLTNTMSVRGEFLYLLFKDSNRNYVSAAGTPVVCPSGTSCGINYTYSAEIARLGVNWKLN